LTTARVEPDRIVWPSADPNVAEDLVLDLTDEPSLFWFRGYFFDFPRVVHPTEAEQLEAIATFLRDLFAECILCGVRLEGDRVVGGGPIWRDGEAHPGSWHSDPSVRIRSWRGTYDRG
jgi:hypothetical protein